MSKTDEIIRKMVPDAFDKSYKSESSFVLKHWFLYKAEYPGGEQSLNGNIFEALIEMTLRRKKILPFYKQASVSFIPNVNYDIIIYTEEHGPVSLSLKTSLRERYKQADLEALALKNIHRKAKSFLVTLDEKECKLRKKNIGDMMAIDDVLCALSPEYDELLNCLARLTATKAPIVKLISSGREITA